MAEERSIFSERYKSKGMLGNYTPAIIFGIITCIIFINFLALGFTARVDEVFRNFFYIVGITAGVFSIVINVGWVVHFTKTRKEANIGGYIDFDRLKNLKMDKRIDARRFKRLFNKLLLITPRQLAEYLRTNLDKYKNCKYISVETLNDLLLSLTSKLGFGTIDNMLNDEDRLGDYIARITTADEEEIEPETVKEKVVETKDDIDLSIPISKVYFVKKYPTDKKGMISGLPIDIKKDKVVACPHCGNMAVKDLLEKWLKENYCCPVCKQIEKIEDFPIVKIDY